MHEYRKFKRPFPDESAELRAARHSLERFASRKAESNMKATFRQNVRPDRTQDLIVQCSGYDAVVQAVPVSFALLYERTLPSGRLLAALPELLAQYPLFAGRLGFSGERLHIDCRSGYIPTEVVQRSDTLEHALNLIARGAAGELAIQVNAVAALKRGAPAITLRLSQFAAGGSCLAICSHHSIGDAQTVISFLRSWGDLVSGRAPQRPTLPEDRHAYVTERVEDNGLERPGVRRVRPAELARLLLILARNRWNTKHALFYFTDDEIERMRKAYQDEAGVRLSANDALCAHVFTSINDVSKTSSARRLSVVVNWRKRVGLPDTLMGNMISTLNVQARPGTPAAQVAAELRDGLTNYAHGHMDYFCNERFIDAGGGHKQAGRMLPAGIDPVRGTLLISSLKQLGAYDIEFDGARPMYCGVLNSAMPYLSLMIDGFHKRGALYSVFLPARLRNALCSEASLRGVHRYRDKYEECPEIVRKIDCIN